MAYADGPMTDPPIQTRAMPIMRDRGKIDMGMERVSTLITTLTNQVDDLEGVLSGVTRAAEPRAVEGRPENPEPTHSPMAVQLTDMAERLEKAISRLGYIVERVEL